MSVPMPPGIIRAPTAAATPPLDPPGIMSVFHGFRAAPVTALLVVMPKASSCMLPVAASIAPASKSALATGAGALAT